MLFRLQLVRLRGYSIFILKFAMQYITSLDEFVYQSRINSDDGEKIFYLCKNMKSCPTRLYIHLPATSTLCVVYRADEEHTHSHKSTYGIQIATRTAIQQLYSATTKHHLATNFTIDS